MTNTKQVNAAALSWYADQGIIKNWRAAEFGTVPTVDMFETVHAMPSLSGNRQKQAGCEALHIAMCLRPEGCTVWQFMMAGKCGPANNYRRWVVGQGFFTESKPAPKVFKLTLTAKGIAHVKAVRAGKQSPVATAKVQAPANGKGKPAPVKGPVSLTSKAKAPKKAPTPKGATAVTQAKAPVAPKQQPATPLPAPQTPTSDAGKGAVSHTD